MEKASSNSLSVAIVLSGVFLGCDEPEKKTQDTMESSQDSGQPSTYGTCSLELVSASGVSFSVLTVGASTVEIHLAFVDEDNGEQIEEHPLQLEEEGQSSLSWALDLEQVSNPTDVVLGRTTMWTSSVFDPIDKVFVAKNDNDEVCDCWDVSTEYCVIDCATYGE